MDCYIMLNELQRLENLSEDYSSELRLLSKRIRRDFWTDRNEKKLSALLKKMNTVFEVTSQYVNYFDLSFIFEYIKILARYCVIICPHLNVDYYNQLIDDIQLENARIIIESQWDNITATEDGLKSFKEIFHDFFTKCFSKYKDRFFYKLSNTDVLCRVVDDKCEITKERFIPLDNTATLNRWNPPGKTYLYLSFTEKDNLYNPQLKISEYVCLEEYRAKKGNKYFFCNFKPVREGFILDLSYNDTSLRAIKNTLFSYQDELTSSAINELMSNPNAIEKYKNKGRLKKDVKKIQEKYTVEKNVIEENYARQYLKMICSCIYKKVDENDNDKKELAYKSFWALAQYLEEQGVTGIIYPCTRTNKIQGKNLVLFSKYDAEPIESSIREYNY